MEFNKNEYGEIKYEDMKQAIENAEGIDDVMSLRATLEDEFVENSLECSLLLSEKEELYNL